MSAAGNLIANDPLNNDDDMPPPLIDRSDVEQPVSVAAKPVPVLTPDFIKQSTPAELTAAVEVVFQTFPEALRQEMENQVQFNSI